MAAHRRCLNHRIDSWSCRWRRSWKSAREASCVYSLASIAIPRQCADLFEQLAVANTHHEVRDRDSRASGSGNERKGSAGFVCSASYG